MRLAMAVFCFIGNSDFFGRERKGHTFIERMSETRIRQ